MVSAANTPIKAACLVCLLTLGVGQAQTVQDFFDQSKVQDIRLTINPRDWAKLRQTYLDDTYYPANFLWNGVELLDIGIRSRGRGSRSPIKPNLRLDFNRFEQGQDLFGLKSVVLKANNQDASTLHERISMSLFARMGLPAPREVPIRLYVNEQLFGFYSMVESIDKDFLNRSFGDKEGYLYKLEPVEEGFYLNYLGDEPKKYLPLPFQAETHEKNPQPATLIEMIRTVNQASDTEFESAVSKYLDLSLYFRYLAVETYLAEFDGILGDVFGMNNFYLYQFSGKTVFQFIPWDKDATFDWVERSILKGADKNVLTRRALEIPAFRKLFYDSLWEISVFAGGPDGWMVREMNTMYAQIAPWARQDPSKQCPGDGGQVACGAGEFEDEVSRIRAFAIWRGYTVQRELLSLGYQPPEVQP